MSERQDFIALDWVTGEIDETLKQASLSLEAFIINRDDDSNLRFFLSHIHQVHRTLQMVEFPDAALLAEEMEALADGLIQQNIHSSHIEDALVVLQNAITQCPLYLEQVKLSRHRLPAMLIPVLNDLRAARGEHLLSETVLFAPDLSGLNQTIDNDQLSIPDSELIEIAQKLRQMFQVALLGVIRGNDVKNNLNYLAKVCARLVKLSKGFPPQALWKICIAVLEGLLNGSIEISVAIKMLLRQVDRQVKSLVESGALGMRQAPPEDLVRNLLYYVARSQSTSRFISEAKSEFSLASSLIVEGEFSNKKMTAADNIAKDLVTHALIRELVSVRDVLDVSNLLFTMPSIMVRLKAIDDAMAMLGMVASLKKLKKIHHCLTVASENAYSIDDEWLDDVKNKIVDLEANLRPADIPELNNSRELFNDSEEAQQQLDKAFSSVIRESRQGLEHVREAIIKFVATQGDQQCLKQMPELLANIAGSLRMIPLARAPDLLLSCGRYITGRLLTESSFADWQQLDKLADAITSVDYYLERLDSLGDAEERNILEVAVTSVAELGYPIISDEKRLADEIDPEILEIFVEEVAEVLAEIDQCLLQWNDNYSNQELGNVVRRAFHTLKGSGRMVGASDVGDLAWSIENMLNRVLEGSITMDAPRLNLIVEARHEIPTWVDAYEHGTDLDKSLLLSIIHRASAFSDEQDPLLEPEDVIAPTLADGAGTDAVAIAEQLIEEASGEAEQKSADNVMASLFSETMDGELLEIFATEAAAHGQVLDDFISHCRDLAGPAELTDELQRALHTLKGSANMAGITPVVTIVTPLEHTVKELRASQLKVDEELLALLERGSLYLKAGIEQLASSPLQPFSDADHYTAQLKSLLEYRIAKIIDTEAEEKGIPPEALNNFLTTSLDLIIEISGKLVLWQQGDYDLSELGHFQQSMNDFVKHAASVNMSGPVEFGKVLQIFYRRGAAQENGHPSDDFFRLAENGNDCLIDMLDQIAGQQTPTFNRPLLSDIENFQFLTVESAANDGTDEKVISPPAEANETESEDHAVVADDDFDALLGEFDGDTLIAVLSEDAELMANSAIVDDDFADVIGRTVIAGDSSESDQPGKSDAAIAKSAGEDAESAATSVDTDEQTFHDLPEVLNSKQITPVMAELVEEPVTAGNGKFGNVSSAGNRQSVFTQDSDDDIDREILEIFLEEADELLENIDETIHSWSVERDKREYFDDMLRILHTLKGGARLAGLTSLGDLSHNFETSLAHLEGKNGEIDENTLVSCQRYQDQLIEQIAAIKSGTGIDEGQQNIDGAFIPIDADSVEEFASEATIEGPLAVDITVDELKPSSQTSDELDREVSRELSDLIPDARVEESAVCELESDNTKQGFPEAESAPDKIAVLKDVDPIKVSFPRSVAPLEAVSLAVDPAIKKAPQEMVKVSAQLLEELVNLAGETSISRGRAEEQISELVASLDDMQITVDRLQEQVRRLDMETEQQILYRQEQVEIEGSEGFDPLEMDRYSQLQQLSRSLLESSSDLVDIKSTLAEKSRDMETLLIQQSRINTDLQEGLMRSRMVPFSKMVPRLRRIIRQVSGELGKKVDFHLSNIEGELDRTVLDRMVSPLEHMLRNAVDHGIESTDERDAAGKPRRGSVTLDLLREGGEIVFSLSDDGAGVNFDAVKKKAIDRGLMMPNSNLADHEIAQFILQPGFSTAEEVTQISGRGVGMDVVNSEIKQLGGSMDIQSVAGKGSRFTVRLPFTVSVNRALMVSVSGDSYAIPLNTIEGIVRVSPFELEAYYQPDAPLFEYAGQPYTLRYMGGLLNRGETPSLEGHSTPLPVVLVRGGEHAIAVQVDSLMGSREIVVKPLGPQFSAVQGLSGATVLGDGNVVVILDLLALIRADASTIYDDLQLPKIKVPDDDDGLVVMVVDDSVTVRKVTSRLLERHGMDVLLAKDGVDAVMQLQDLDRIPDVMLLDIEMPRMDGFEVASRIRHNSRLQDIPIIMITSRTGEKHRDRALALGVNEYLGKPYQETELLNIIQALTATTSGQL
ncbi:sensor histidine kinase/response regulator [marine gamma proteobacterium HTCC2143]|uniref:Chemotaxis protein CheA n=1 Tax=marine gamma proteobacterium HTCC2143 TaxID=247633 RepID=A0Y9Q4_9GAMM|nr:sensor histidine kinase/response regulator [marine gamma proteobacterium HTCC2143]